MSFLDSALSSLPSNWDFVVLGCSNILIGLAILFSACKR